DVAVHLHLVNLYLAGRRAAYGNEAVRRRSLVRDREEAATRRRGRRGGARPRLGDLERAELVIVRERRCRKEGEQQAEHAQKDGHRSSPWFEDGYAPARGARPSL